MKKLLLLLPLLFLAGCAGQLGANPRVLLPSQGGTGVADNPTANQILIGDGSGKYIVDDLSNYANTTQSNWEVVNGYLTPTTTIGIAINGTASSTDIQTSYVDFNTWYTDGSSEGRLQWNSDDGTLEVGMPGGNVNLQIGQEMIARVKNESGDTITNGKLLYRTGSVDGKALVSLADNSSDDTARVMCMATEDIADSQFGYCSTIGFVRDLDTSGYTVNDMLYLGENGNFTTTTPATGKWIVRIGRVARVSDTVGIIDLSLDRSWKTTQLKDVSRDTATQDQLLSWNNTNSVWTPTSTTNLLQGTFTNLNSVNATTTRLCFSDGECMTSPTSFGSQITFYPHNTDSDIATYEEMFTYPDGETAIDESCTANSAVNNGYCVIDTYISTSTDIAIVNYPAGTTRVHASTYVNSSAGDSRLVFKGYKRTALGVETELGTATTTEIDNLAIQEVIATFTGSEDFAFNSDGTDRLVLKVMGWTDSSADKVIHWTYQNTGSYSQMETPITLSDSTYTKSNVNETISGAWTFTGNLVVGNATSTHWATAVGNSDQWNQAFSWGNHADAGYLTEGSSGLLDINSQQLGQLSDVSTSTLAVADILMWNGSSWINQATTSIVMANETTAIQQSFWNSTSTWAGFSSEWNKYTNASSTIMTNADISTSAQVRALISDETGTGAMCFATEPTFTTGINVSGYASSTSLHINEFDVASNGNATSTRMTIWNGTNGIRIIPGATTTFEGF